jgi:hypothetical protein
MAINPDCPQRGLMKPRKGFTPVMGSKDQGEKKLALTSRLSFDNFHRQEDFEGG